MMLADFFPQYSLMRTKFSLLCLETLYRKSPKSSIMLWSMFSRESTSAIAWIVSRDICYSLPPPSNSSRAISNCFKIWWIKRVRLRMRVLSWRKSSQFMRLKISVKGEGGTYVYFLDCFAPPSVDECWSCCCDNDSSGFNYIVAALTYFLRT